MGSEAVGHLSHPLFTFAGLCSLQLVLLRGLGFEFCACWGLSLVQFASHVSRLVGAACAMALASGPTRSLREPQGSDQNR